MAFKDLKKNRTDQLTKLTSEVSKLNTTQEREDDDNFWKPEVDKAGNGMAIIRFLPAPTGEDVPFVRIFDHGFKGPGGWFIEKSLTTIGKDDPVSEYNSQLWNSTSDDSSPQRKQVRLQKRRLSFVSNIYVVKDPANPQNEGKVMLFKYGKKIFDKLNEAMNPQFDDETPMNPFDMWEGANFKLKIRNVEGYRNYDKSEFEESSVLGEFDDDKLEQIWNQEQSLQAFLEPSKFKTYEELKVKLYRVLGLDGSAAKAQSTAAGAPWDDGEEFESKPKTLKAKAPPKAPSVEEDDEDLDFFKRLAEED